jgi:predicted RND superfamily exporter protein
VPDSRELAAQYLLLYEMSLPLGMDLNDQINVDKSATRLSVNFRASTIAEVADVGDEAEAWLVEHGVNAYPDHATGPPVMFSKITETNIKSMVKGTLLGFVLIAIVLMISLRSATLGLLSMIPNIVPAATAFGIWALVVGEAGFAISVVAGLSIGIIVDDTVHFLSKYSRARRELGLNSEDAVRYAFTTVGQALLDTSIIVAGGFSVLMLSTFRVTSFMGALTALTIVCALVADFLLLPAILLILDRRDMTGAASDSEQEAA